MILIVRLLVITQKIK